MSALVETMAYAGEVPWHGLGTKVPHDLSTDDMLKQSGLDWSVEKLPTCKCTVWTTKDWFICIS